MARSAARGTDSRKRHLTVKEANSVWDHDYESTISDRSNESEVSFDSSQRPPCRRPSRDSYGSEDRGEWHNRARSRDFTSEILDIEESLPAEQSHRRPIVMPIEFRRRRPDMDEGYVSGLDSDEEVSRRRSSRRKPKRRPSIPDEPYDPYSQSHDEQSSRRTASSRESRHRPNEAYRTYSLSDDDVYSQAATSGESLSHTGAHIKSPSEANDTWQSTGRVSKRDAKRYQRNHSKKPYRPTSKDSTRDENGALPSAMRASDLTTGQFLPMDPRKQRLRVGFNITKEDWAKNYWKKDEASMEADEVFLGKAPMIVETFSKKVERSAADILTQGWVSRTAQSDMTDEEFATHVHSSAKSLSKACIAVTELEQVKFRNERRKRVAERDGKIAELLPEPEVTAEQLTIFNDAQQIFAPTTEMTMADNFPIMKEFGLSDLHTLDPSDSYNTPLIKEASEKLTTAMSQLSSEEREALKDELQRFSEAKLTRREDMSSLGFDMLSHRSTMSFFQSGRKSGHQSLHAADLLSFMLSGRTVVCDNTEGLRRYLDTGEGIEPDEKLMGGIEGYQRDWILNAGEEGDRYSDSRYMPTRSLETATTEATREAIIRNFTIYQNTHPEGFDRTAGGVTPDPAAAPWVHQLLANLSLYGKSIEQLQELGDRRLQKKMKRLERTLNNTTYYTSDKFAELYPDIGKYKSYAEALDASESTNDPDLPSRWRYQLNVSSRRGDVETLPE